MSLNVYIALVHHPVLNRRGETITTAVTNLDIHDLARTARTFDVRATVLVTPLEQQRSLVSRIVGHWQRGEGKTYNPVRAVAFERVRVAMSVEEACAAITTETGTAPVVVGTGAALTENTIPYGDLGTRMTAPGEETYLVLFGTGWGLTDDVIEGCDLLLPRIKAVDGHDDYNHLSVRAAVAIVLDRLLGER